MRMLTFAGSSRPQDGKAAATEDDSRQKPTGMREEGPGAAAAEGASPLGAIGNDGSGRNLNDDQDAQATEVIDPLAGMSAADRWGIKGLRTLMNNYPDYHAMVVGMDPMSLGLDMSSPE